MSHIMQGGTVMANSAESPESVKAHTVADVDSEVPIARTLGIGVQAAAFENKISGALEDPQSPPVASAVARETPENPSERGAVFPSHASTSACSCGGGEACSCGANTSVQPVYALGRLGFDFVTEARRDSIAQHMEGSPSDPNQLLAYLEENPWDAAAIIWTLNLDATPIYTVQPLGVFASEGYQRLRQFLREQLTEGVERISLAGIIVGKARLMSGQVVPAVRPELRCMYSWTTAALVEAAVGEAAEENEDNAQRRQDIRNFLERVYHELRNLGLTSQERAINYAATNAFNVNNIFEAAFQAKMELDAIEVERSPICRPDSDCWDVKLLFFDPENVLRSRRAYRFTVDVSDVCPVMVGDVRSWSVR